MQKKKKKGDDYPCLLIINFPICMQYKHKSGKKFRTGACKSIVLLSSSGGTLYLPNAIRQDEPLVNQEKCRFGVQELWLHSHGEACQLCCNFSSDLHQLAKKSQRHPQECCLWNVYLPAKEVPRQIRRHTRAEEECGDCMLAAESAPCSSEGMEACLMGQKPQLQDAFLSGSWTKAKHNQTHNCNEKHLRATHLMPPALHLFSIWGAWRFSGYNTRCGNEC